jgi:hypothetical protein
MSVNEREQSHRKLVKVSKEPEALEETDLWRFPREQDAG